MMQEPVINTTAQILQIFNQIELLIKNVVANAIIAYNSGKLQGSLY